MVNILTRLMTEPVITYSSLDCLYRISCQVPLHNDRCVKSGEPIFGEPAWGPWEESECAGLDHYLDCIPRIRAASLSFLSRCLLSRAFCSGSSELCLRLRLLCAFCSGSSELRLRLRLLCLWSASLPLGLLCLLLFDRLDRTCSVGS